MRLPKPAKISVNAQCLDEKRPPYKWINPEAKSRARLSRPSAVPYTKLTTKPLTNANRKLLCGDDLKLTANTNGVTSK
jgi:hypothetical protein